jgi:hypothetical protein
MTSGTDISYLITKINALESKIELLESQLKNAVTFSKLTAIRLLLEDKIRELEIITSTISSEVSLIKTRLKIK